MERRGSALGECLDDGEILHRYQRLAEPIDDNPQVLLVAAQHTTIINDAGRLVFHAEPEGQKSADFHSTARDYAPPELEFVNTAHDYPQRIRYWREGALLIAEISLADGSKPQRWTYRRVK